MTPSQRRAVAICGLFVLYVGLAAAIFADSKLGTFSGAAMAVTGALAVIPQLVASAVSQLDRR